ncbi:hypothetical protein ABW21_db0202686 [Orbilia brochopaga]|nr:hypothetical protein ABW21_db0202686 [Drechslerella brochopaga]
MAVGLNTRLELIAAVNNEKETERAIVFFNEVCKRVKELPSSEESRALEEAKLIRFCLEHVEDGVVNLLSKLIDVLNKEYPKEIPQELIELSTFVHDGPAAIGYSESSAGPWGFYGSYHKWFQIEHQNELNPRIANTNRLALYNLCQAAYNCDKKKLLDQNSTAGYLLNRLASCVIQPRLLIKLCKFADLHELIGSAKFISASEALRRQGVSATWDWSYWACRERERLHAEIKVFQVLACMKRGEFAPYIGCSKPACFCCWHFLQASRLAPGNAPMLDLPRSHMKLYTTWRIPNDISSYAVHQMVKRLK